MATTKKIRLGICMAGAVSAGAYTAGVIDYLVETLERWERQKQIIRKKKEEGKHLTESESLVPLHDTVIEVLSGASAGGMTAAVLAYSFNDDSYITKRNNDIIDLNYDVPLANDKKTKLYDSWINMVDDDKGTTFSKLMDTSDVKSINTMSSVLNSQPIDDIAFNAVPAKIDFKPPAYISKDICIILSVTNVEGVPVDIRFSNIDDTNPTRNVLWMHSGYLHYQYQRQDYNLNFPPEIISDEFKHHLAGAAKATGAFPFGLKNREIFVTPEIFNEFKRRIKENDNLEVNITLEKNDKGEVPNYFFTAVDGGAINNEPVGTTEKVLSSKQKIKVDTENVKEEHYVILIDPFPTVTNDSGKKGFIKPEPYTLINQAKKLLTVFRNQSSFKQEDLLKGLEMQDNKFLIYPSKRRRYFLACGELMGFSGFLKKAFREHDYQLGRKNCQAFLRYYFGISVEELEKLTNVKLEDNQYKKWKYDANYGKEGLAKDWKVPLIPDMLMLKTNDVKEGEEKEIKIKEPEYDGLTVDEMKTITNSIDERIRKIVEATYPSIADSSKSIHSVVGWFVSRWPLKGILKKMINNALSEKVIKHLNKTFRPQTIKQDILVTKIADIIEREGGLYQKIKGVWAIVANGGEYIESKPQAGIESDNTASAGDYIVTNDTKAKERYIIKPKEFNERYEFSHKDSVGDYYKPTDKARVHALQLTHQNVFNKDLIVFEELGKGSNVKINIEPSWKSSQDIEINDYLVCSPLKNEVYKIAELEFNETYEKVKKK